MNGYTKTKNPTFQSTSSVWRTTTVRGWAKQAREISIHVLRVEDDAEVRRNATFASVFQSTSSVWRTTELDDSVVEDDYISIHVLRVEDD